MCVYCMIGDHAWKFSPPFTPIQPHPLLPKPVVPGPFQDWPIARLREFEDLLRRVKAIEDQLGCPCEPAKADHIGIIRERITRLEEMD